MFRYFFLAFILLCCISDSYSQDSTSVYFKTGSHKIYRNPEGRRTTVPFHAHKILHPKLLKSILNEAGLSVEELKSLL